MTFKDTMVIAYLGLGSNLGNREINIENAISHLQDNNITILQCSRIIETTPIGGPAHQNNYLNGVIKIKTSLSPHQLLNLVKNIEHKLGRIKIIHNGPRLIDLDILLYGQTVYNNLNMVHFIFI